MPELDAGRHIINSVADIGYQVWLKRRALGMTQIQVASLCGVGVRFISELENGKSTIEMGRAIRVLSKLGLSVYMQQDSPSDE